MTDSNRFLCRRCRRPIAIDAPGTGHRNHCPGCLWSLHLDDLPGDRSATCGGLMEPIAVWVRGGGEWALVHRCQRCGALKSNRIAGDDDPLSLVSLAVRAIAEPPFPLEHLMRMPSR